MPILGSHDLAATTNTDLMSGGMPYSGWIERIQITNRTAGAITIRLYIVPADVDLADKHAVAYGQNVPANSSVAFTGDFLLSKNDRVVGYASGTGISMNVYGRQNLVGRDE